MKFRRKTRPRARRRPGMKGDWVIGAESNCLIPLDVSSDCQDTPTTALSTFLSLIDSQDLLDKEDAMTVVRIVGDVPVSFRISTPEGSNPPLVLMTMREGIYVAGADGALPVADVIANNPALTEDLELDSWMWLRTRSFHLQGPLGGGVAWQSPQDYAQLMNTHLDLRVKRKLKRGQELVYVVYCFHETLVASGSMSLFGGFAPHLRCYVKF